MPTNQSVGFPASAAREHDLELARRAAAGDRAAQRELFLEQRANVHRALFRILGSNREIEDLLQDSFIEIFRALPTFRGDSTLGRWCQTIAVRVAYLAISRRRPPAVDLSLVEETIAGDADVRRHVQVREATRRLYAALDRIEAKQRIAFALAVIDGKSLAEVAELTDSSVFAIKTRVWRARRELMRRAGKDAALAAYVQDLEGGES
ncbi:MAG: RNA polymerase sigma factor [Deltaproteobacteria bacterium]|nr:MAG: RNA polymerase sigma factor [Deltaproteobacteria bacterium]TMQ23196.1 MAG: RNA polymerase sigma factor [Deltaproteobacteria bacterium]